MSTSNPNIDGLPDIATLTQLANRFFAAVPDAGAAPAPVTGLPPGLSHLSGNIAHPPALPTLPTLPTPPSSIQGFGASPQSATQSAPHVPQSLTGDIPLTNGVSPEAFVLPGDADLKRLLAPVNARHLGTTGVASPVANTDVLGNASFTPSFYFLEHANSAQPGIAVPGLQQSAWKQDTVTGVRPAFDINSVRRDFPILQEHVNGQQLVWLDNAATTHKPQSVIDRIAYFYAHENSNIHRAAHELAARATDAYEAAREKVRAFINASSTNEVVFVRGTTEAINLVANTWGQANIGRGDEIIVSHLEHHANIVPWQMLCQRTGAVLKVIPVDDDGQVLLDAYAKLLTPKTKLVSFTQVSNALGTVTPAKTIIDMAHHAGAKVLLDGAQSVSHLRADVTGLNCDWFVFSGHKVFGPTGIGVLYGKEALLNETPPWQGGGNMIRDVTFEHTQYHDAPGRFEAGTGNIADAVGLGAAIDYVNKIGIDHIHAYEHQLLVYATQHLESIPGLRLIGTAPDKAAVLSFVLEGYKTEEVGAALNKNGVAVRSGHHCAQPILRRFGLEATVRPSLAFYNDCNDIDRLVQTLHQLTGKRRGY
jgi:cysteine desulfurase/selenocysteine lyase